MRQIVYMLAAFAAIGCGGGGAAGPTDPGAAPPESPPPNPGTPGQPATPPSPPSPPPPAPPNAPPPPLSATITTQDRFFVQSEVRIAVGGTVTFVIDDNWHEITFTPLPVEGNIVHIEEGESVSRTFAIAGTYRFHCNRHDDGGTIHVVDATAAPPTPPAPGSPPPSGPAATVSTPGVSFSPATVTISAGQSVMWQITGARHNVTFRGAQPAGGNIPDTEPGTAVSRTFTTPGTYPYDCTRHSGMSGTIHVQ